MKNRYWLILVTTLVLLSSTLMLSCSSTPATITATSTATITATETKEVQTFDLIYTKVSDENHKPSTIPMQFFASEVEKRTNGRIKFSLFPGTLFSPPEIFDGVLKGKCDLGDSVASYTPGMFPVMECVDLPFGYTKMLPWTRAVVDFYNKFQPEEFSQVKVLYFSGTTPSVIGMANKSLRTLDDFKGNTIRCPGTISTFIEALGATPRSIPFDEIYEGLSKKMVDGIALPFEAYGAIQVNELITQVTDIGFVSYGNFIFGVMNMDVWNKLPADLQQILIDVGVEYGEYRAQVTEDIDQAERDLFLTLPGRDIITVSPEEQAKFRAAADKVIQAWVVKKTAEGYPAQDYVDYFRERLEYWNKQ